MNGETTKPLPRLRVLAEGLSDVGLQREHNEDSYVVLREYELYVVADGMGGHRAGDVASKLATETIGEFFRSTATEDVTWPFHFDTNLSEEENRLLTGIRVANRQIFERSARSREHHGMGTTVVGCMFSADKQRIYIGHVGDSRCYRVRNGHIQQMTRDHSLVNDYLLAMPDLTDEQKSELPKNVITRALGMQDHVVVDIQHDDPRPGDVYVLCSDGLSGMVEDDELEAIINAATSGKEACRRLIQRANERGGEDNITALVIRVEFESPDSTGIPSTEESPTVEMSAYSEPRSTDPSERTTDPGPGVPVSGVPAVTISKSRNVSSGPAPDTATPVGGTLASVITSPKK